MIKTSQAYLWMETNMLIIAVVNFLMVEFYFEYLWIMKRCLVGVYCDQFRVSD